jgi:uncharacterized membrane protein YbhN (UPF0104 family)
MKQKAVLRVVVTALVVAGGVGLASTLRRFDWATFGRALAHVSALPLAMALCTGTVQVFAQLARFAAIVPRQDRARLGTFLDVTAVGQLLNYTTPLRAGDAYKLARLSPSEADPQGRFANVASALVLERVADILALVLIAALALGSLGDTWELTALPARSIAWRAGLAAAFAAIVVVAVALRPPRALVRFLRNTRETMGSLRFVGCVAVALVAWSLDAGALWWTARSGGCAIAFAAAVQCVFVLNVGIALPLTVASLGIFEATLAFALSRHAIGAESALVIATLDHFVILAGHVLCVAIVRISLWGRRL